MPKARPFGSSCVDGEQSHGGQYFTNIEIRLIYNAIDNNIAYIVGRLPARTCLSCGQLADFNFVLIPTAWAKSGRSLPLTTYYTTIRDNLQGAHNLVLIVCQPIAYRGSRKCFSNTPASACLNS